MEVNLERFNIATTIIMNKVYSYYMDELKHPHQKIMFHDWWYSNEHVATEEYQKTLGLTIDMYDEVRGCILEATSRGCG